MSPPDRTAATRGLTSLSPPFLATPRPACRGFWCFGRAVSRGPVERSACSNERHRNRTASCPVQAVRRRSIAVTFVADYTINVTAVNVGGFLNRSGGTVCGTASPFLFCCNRRDDLAQLPGTRRVEWRGPSTFESLRRSTSGTNLNSASESTNFLMSHGHATRSTLTFSRVIHRMAVLLDHCLDGVLFVFPS